MKRSLAIALALVSVAAVATVFMVGLQAMRNQPLASLPPTPVLSSNDRWQPQMSDGGGVQIAAVPLEGNELAFQVSLSTHSVELGGYDLARLSRVTVDAGSPMTEATWTPEGPTGGHHVSGVLTFRAPNGQMETAKQIELEIADVANVKARKFLWTAGGK